MGQVIPEALHETVSPLLLAAGLWPEAESLQSIAELREQAEKPEDVVVDAAAQASLVDTVKLLHGALRNQPAAERLYWNEQQELFYQLRYQAPEEPPKDGDKYEHWLQWSGWATFAPADEQAPVFRVFASCEEPVETLDYEGLAKLWGDLLTNKLRDEVTRAEEKTSFFPNAAGPDQLAGVTDLDMAGFGARFPYMYSYSDGRQIVVAFQSIPHAPAGIAGVRPR